MAVGTHTRVIARLYRSVLKPLLFRLDPEEVHNRFVNIGAMLGATAAGQWLTGTFFAYDDPILNTTVAGIPFKNPIGLAAGFDKNARMATLLSDIGFGFGELGSVTGKPCTGNPRPRLWRLPDRGAIIVNYGLVNDGADSISTRLRGVRFRTPIGISAAKTNDASTGEPDAGIADYAHVLERFRGIGDYFTVNISCPNACGGTPFTNPALLDRLLTRVDELADKPVFLKLAVDLTHEQLDAIVEVCAKHRIAGFVCSNLTKRESTKGGVSGKPMQAGSDEQIRYLYRNTGGRSTIIGVGGIFSAADAYRKIRLGASLLQLITGMIYEGPQLIGQINTDLAKLLRRDGFDSVARAVGVDANSWGD